MAPGACSGSVFAGRSTQRRDDAHADDILSHLAFDFLK
jgi:hypothetical protein